ncbi:MAG: HD domain-containing protein [Clostridiales bacterium]|nr:HD domain-containing protein [Clostridiales bacterium]
MITYDDIRNNAAVNSYIRAADSVLEALRYTEHGFAHVGAVAKTAGYILESLGYPEREAELARIAAYLHDIGNVVNRVDHAESGAVMAFQILTGLGMPADEIAVIVSAIGNHNEGTAEPVNPVAAALILADKTDVRRSRVRLYTDVSEDDIHDRVNFAAEKSEVRILEDGGRRIFELSMTLDTEYGSVMNFFEIYLDRMALCRKACSSLGMEFRIMVNGQRMTRH